jgi:pimeloyl-ACP methyl ester carboxylesterase/membrane protein DedA with SNARE-associated domain
VRRRPVLTAYLALLAASHLYRRTHPPDESLRPGERTAALFPVAGDREVPRAPPVRLAYFDLGPDSGEVRQAAPVVLLIHGSPGDVGSFWGVAPALARRFRVLNVDLPGFGRSTRSIPDYSIRAHAHYLLQLLDSLRVPRVHAVGFSMGGGVALELAELAPARVQSLVLLSSIGAQEFELLGDYQLNHLIHGIQLGGLWLLREAVPHFGALDRSFLGVEYARNFYDTDQRPLRGIMERLTIPVLILHGEHDPLVTPAAAREHARLIPQSELRMDLGDHFAVFVDPPRVSQPIADFVTRVERGAARDRAAANPDRLTAAALPFDRQSVPPLRGFSLVVVLLLLAAGTLLSEDLTCITAGLMVARGTLRFVPAVVACFIGIYLGDLLLYLAGRWLGRRLLGWRPARWFLSVADVERSSQWFARRGLVIVFLTRLVPGTRLPTYLAAGILRTRFAAFALYFLLACALWTPALVGFAVLSGEAALGLLRQFERSLWLYLLLAGSFLYLVLKVLIPLCTWRGRRLLLSAWRRKVRWEFWPRWVLYPPVVLYILWLGLRYRHLWLFTAANPAMPGGGLAGESKAAILRGLDGGDLVARFDCIPAAVPPEERLRLFQAFRERYALDWPVVLKPDVGERGLGVTIVRNEPEAQRYLGQARGDVIAQEYVPGLEFGVFYVRLPGQPAGRIFSVTEKRLPAVVGDGRSTLEDLILRDDRAVCQAPLHLRRLAPLLSRVPLAGERVQIVELGTHCRGAAFYDGGWIVTPALEEAIDRLSQRYDGFWFGRYDIRTPRVEDFRAGRNFKVLELNGASSEATHIYDPGNSLSYAYRVLFAQWRLQFEIAVGNVERGARPTPLGELWQLLRIHHEAVSGGR